MYIIITIVAVLISFAIGIPLGMVFRKKIAESKIQSAETEAERLVSLAKTEAENLKKEEILKAKEEIMNSKKELDQEIKERRGEIQKQEARIIQKRKIWKSVQTIMRKRNVIWSTSNKKLRRKGMK